MRIEPTSVQFADHTKFLYLLCYIRLLRDVLVNYGYDHIADYVGNEFSFYQVGFKDGIGWYRCTVDPWDVLQKTYHFQIPFHQFGTFREALQHMEAQLEKGILSMSLMDIYYIPMTPQYYQRQHRTHFISVTSISFDREVVTVLDSANSHYNKELNFAMLEEAWSSPEMGLQFDCWDIIPPTEPVTPSREMFFDAMRANIQNMRNPDLQLAHQKARAEFGEYETLLAGLAGLAQLSDSVAKLVDLGKEHLLDMYHLLGTVPEQLELHANYLQRMAERFELTAFGPLAQEMFDIMQNWVVMRNMILKASMRDSAEFLQRCIERCKQIEEMESRFIFNLEETMAALT